MNMLTEKMGAGNKYISPVHVNSRHYLLCSILHFLHYNGSVKSLKGVNSMLNDMSNALLALSR